MIMRSLISKVEQKNIICLGHMTKMASTPIYGQIR